MLWYEIRHVLGRGGFGVTYLAHDKNLDCDVAIKEYFPSEYAHRQNETHSLEPTQSDQDEIYNWGLDKFVTEARTLAKLSHENIVRVSSVFDHNNTAYIVMDFEKGKSLSELIKAGVVFDENMIKHLASSLLDGLGFVHNKGFIHRDIKPANVIIRPDSSPVLLDFGSARDAMKQTKKLTSLVTHGYTPFEQYNASGDQQGPWSDIYALAATFYHMITGRKPVEAMARASQLMNGGADPYEALANIKKGEYSASFLQAIDIALCFKIEDRPQSAAEWKQLLLGDLSDAELTQLQKRFDKTHLDAANQKLAQPSFTPKGNSELFANQETEKSAYTPKSNKPIIYISIIAIVAGVVGIGLLFFSGMLKDEQPAAIADQITASQSTNDSEKSTVGAEKAQEPLKSPYANNTAIEETEEVVIESVKPIVSRPSVNNKQTDVVSRPAEQPKPKPAPKPKPIHQQVANSKLTNEARIESESEAQLNFQSQDRQPKPDFQVVAPTLVKRFKLLFELRQLDQLYDSSVVSDSKRKFARQIFDAYDVIIVEKKSQTITPSRGIAKAVLAITELRTEKGAVVKPADSWRFIHLTVKADKDGIIRVFWQ